MNKELKAFTVTISLGNPNGELTDKKVCLKDEVDALLAEKDREIGELKHSLELATNECCSISERAVKNERRLRRALYKACAMWADRTRLICSVFGSNAPKIRWERMLDKCRAKAEQYK